MEIVISFLVGIVIGCIIVMIFSRLRAVGSLRIDRSDPDDNPYLFLELSKDINRFDCKKYITLKVRNENYISQK